MCDETEQKHKDAIRKVDIEMTCSSNGRKYWLKLKRDFFKRHDIRILEDMENGKEFVLFYLKLMCESIDHEGRLRFSESIPYDNKMLSTITNTDINIVDDAMKIFEELGMIEVEEDKTIVLNEIPNMTMSVVDNDNANRQRRYRERKKMNTLSNDNATVTKNNESNRYSNNKNKKIDNNNIIYPTIPEVRKIIKEKNYVVSAKQFHDYYFTMWWSQGIELSKDWKDVLEEWNERQIQTNQTKSASKKKITLPSYIEDQKNGKFNEGPKLTKEEADKLKRKVKS